MPEFKTVVVDFDDFEDRYDRNGMNFLLYWKSKFPKFKVNIFAIPGRCSKPMLELVNKHSDFISLCVHGWRHDDNFECLRWDEYLANHFIQRAEEMGFSYVFKAPGWQITYPQPYNENPNTTFSVNSEPQLVYKVLMDRGYIVADQHYNFYNRPKGLKVYCTCNPLQVHGHVEDINVSDPKGRNGMRQMEEEWNPFPWDENTEFLFIKDLTEEQLKCTNS